MMTRKAWLYARFSSKKQEQGSSIERQQQAAERYCAANGIELQTTTFFDLGVSGFSKKSSQRPMFRELTIALEQGRIPAGSFLLFESTDRLSREPWIVVQRLIIDTVMKFDVTLVILDKNQVFNKTNILDIGNNIILMVSSDLAAKESERKSDLVAGAYKKKREKGEVSRLPFWISKTATGYELNDKLEIIKLIVELRLKGLGSLGIASELNRRGYKSPRGGLWRHTSVSLAIRNHALYGTKDFITTKIQREFDGTDFVNRKQYTLVKSVADVLPAVIDYPTWQSIQVNGQKPMRKGADSPFAGLLKCKKCGGTLSVHVCRDGHKHRKCANSKVSGCKFSPIRGFDDLLKDCLRTMKYVAPNRAGLISRLPEYQDRLAKLESVKQQLVASGAVDALTDLYKDIAELKSKIEAETKSSVEIVPSMDIKKVFDLPLEEQRRELLARITRIEVQRPVPERCEIWVYLTNGGRRLFFCDLGVGKGNVGKNRVSMRQFV